MTFDEMKQKAAEVWQRLTETPQQRENRAAHYRASSGPDDMTAEAERMAARISSAEIRPEATQFSMRSEPGHVIQRNGEAYRPVAKEDQRLVSVNGALYRTTPSVMMALHQAAERGSTVEGGFSRIMKESLAAGSMVRVAEKQQGWTPDLMIQYAPPVSHAKAHEEQHDRGMSR